MHPIYDLRQTTPPPKYIHPVLPRLLKGTPYSAFASAYPDHRAELRSIVEGESIFTAVRKMALRELDADLVRDRKRRWGWRFWHWNAHPVGPSRN